MKKFSILACVLGVVLICGEAFATGPFARFRQRLVQPRQVQRVVVRNTQRAVSPHQQIQRVVVQPQRVLRVVEVPNLQVRQNLVVTRDQHGRVLDVRQQKIVEQVRVQQNKQRVQAQRIIIQQY